MSTKKLPAQAREIKRIRTQAKFTQQQLATRMNVSVRTISRWEQAETAIPDGTIEEVEIAIESPRKISKVNLVKITGRDIGNEVLERLGRLDALETENIMLRNSLHAYKAKYGDL